MSGLAATLQRAAEWLQPYRETTWRWWCSTTRVRSRGAGRGVRASGGRAPAAPKAPWAESSAGRCACAPPAELLTIALRNARLSEAAHKSRK